MKDILQEIVANKRLEVEHQKQTVSLRMLLALGGERLERETRSMRASLSTSPSGIIAEFKRKSPSKGWLHPDAAVKDVVTAYEKAGAATCSVLTDAQFFGGSLGDLCTARRSAALPLLRKDFIIDEYQIYQARVMGADAVLLIAACLTPAQCSELAELAHTLCVETLLEIHSEEELEHLNPHIDMLGVNNRNLGTFHTDTANSFRLAERILDAVSGKDLAPLLVSESGISQVETVAQLRKAGFRGFLIGETFMKTSQPGKALADFIGGLRDADQGMRYA